jgi:lycopene beta-cyclase
MSQPAPPAPEFDCALVGGGLQNGLLALALLERRPGLRIALVERGRELGAGHTWCFHAADAAAPELAFVLPLVEHCWPGYDVRFHGVERTLPGPYACLSAARLHAVVSGRLGRAPGCALLLGCEAREVGERGVVLADGRELAAALVVDARGPRAEEGAGEAGYQKFVGLEFELEVEHGLARPIVMDARVPQRDGFRFFYTLPLGPRRLLVEDTRFSDSPALAVEELRAEVLAYAERQGWRLRTLAREERGVLPMPWGELCAPAARGPLVAGYAGGWIHPATGYSFPCAARLAALVARTPPSELFGAPLATHAREHRRQARFARLLNRLLFRWYLPEERAPVFERFYRLPEPLIERFYALRTTAADRARILLGRPPRGLSLRARLTASRRSHAALPR